MKLTLEPRPNQEPAPVLDWSTTPLARKYNRSYAKVIDDLFSSEECDALIALAESDAKWAQAAVHYGLEADQQYVDTEYRNSERILRFDHDAAAAIFQRILPHVQELIEIEAGSSWATIVSAPGRIKGTWKLVGLNERLSYLRYGPGHYFREHCDGQLELPDGRKSRVTIQIYLGNDGVEGGATRFHDLRSKRAFDVLPKKGRVLIFQQRGLWHSGEDVVKGLKYTLRSDLMFRQSEEEAQPSKRRRAHTSKESGTFEGSQEPDPASQADEDDPGSEQEAQPSKRRRARATRTIKVSSDNEEDAPPSKSHQSRKSKGSRSRSGAVGKV
ncbi:hypothetical protein EST38_g8684 [Candolleomyces aberdarensis]|uniref:Prolyl 4-hydroxylase alpha subunit domain-containing protein n=1 Tax=Candolleomyces aberdarensis TaxID=2316362 RepID=A0A4Q2DBW0_9AGAR|nr:hypothetical protein EST38_g8684 [Candolleomyces aberdarensis]